MTALRAFARGEMGKSRKGSWRREAQRSENGNQTKAELVQAWGGQIFCVSHGSIGGGGGRNGRPIQCRNQEGRNVAYIRGETGENERTARD